MGRSLPVWLWCALIVAVEAVVVLVVLGQGGAAIRGGDGPEYAALATNLVHHGAFSELAAPPLEPSVFRTPGYPLVLALLDALGAGGPLGVRVVQLGLLVPLALLAGRAAAALHGEAAGRLTALLCAGYAPLVWLATEHLTEVLAALLTAALALALLRARARGTAHAWALAGLVLGAGTLVRPAMLLLAAPVALAAVLEAGGLRGPWRRRARWAPALALVGAAGVLLVPWAVRTSLLVHRPAALVTASGGSMWMSAEQWRGRMSFHMGPEDWLRYQAVARPLTAKARAAGWTPQAQFDADARFAALARWDEVGPGDVLRRLPARLAALLGPVDEAPAGHDLAVRAGAAEQLALLALMLAGLLLRRRTLLREWPLWIVGAATIAQHLVFHVEPRYAIPGRPLLVAYAAVGGLALARRVSTARSTSRAARPMLKATT